jgi:hypothetical protein
MTSMWRLRIRKSRRREKGRSKGPNRPSKHMAKTGRTGMVYFKRMKRMPSGTGETHCWPLQMPQAALMI